MRLNIDDVVSGSAPGVTPKTRLHEVNVGVAFVGSLEAVDLMPNVYMHWKPSLWCMLLHQAAWVEVTEEERGYFCQWCDKYFMYPTLKEQTPVYRR